MKTYDPNEVFLILGGKKITGWNTPIVANLFGPPEHEDTCVCDECMDAMIDQAFEEDPERTPKMGSGVISSCPPPGPPRIAPPPKPTFVAPPVEQPAEKITPIMMPIGTECYYCGSKRKPLLGKVASSGSNICKDCAKTVFP